MNAIQYTIRNIPPEVDRVIRKRARQTGQSFNSTVVEALTRQTLGAKGAPLNFDWLFGAKTLGDGFDDAVKQLSEPDEQLWQ